MAALEGPKLSSLKEKESKDKKKKAGNNRVYFWATECKYSVILDTVADLDWKLVEDEKLESKVNLFWIDVATIHEHFRTIQPWQCINHFPGMPNIARKNRMGQNLNRMQKMFPKEYSFYPRTWVLPGEMADFRTQFDSYGNALNNKIFIIKPDAGCQGRGIFLTRTLDTVPVNENVVAQVYIKKPLLLDGYKFDLRIYCIVTSVKPLRMYLFQDGLVRMCTEEYVKPTKENLGMACMHLTNYAVNKHNENFQQPTGDSADDNQDGFKRSLLWFMNWVRDERGEAKANWLWKRIGVLCTRTLLSIMPTLSREYDQHFKSFSGIPVDISKIPTTASTAPNAKAPTGGASSRGRSTSRSNRVGSSTSVGRESGEENEEEDNNAPSASAGSESNLAEEHEDGEKKENEEEDDGNPKTRGSRCFEVLGFDIMIDNSLNPILIEVNHLPSFGTDSKLDKDIKERLMQQVFSVLPVMADDHAAYLAFHKAESEKRLNAQKAKQQPPAQEKKPNPAPRRREPTLNSNKNLTDQNDNTASLETKGEQSEDNDSTMNNDGNHENGEIDQNQTDTAPGVAELAEQEEDDEECTPERLEEIKKILIDIYEKFSPEKLNKIDRLLAKYLGHEEEFLQFVFSKYNVSPVLYPSIVKPSLNAKYGYGPQPTAPSSSSNDQQSSNLENQETNLKGETGSTKEDADSAQKSGSQSTKGSNNNNARDGVKRYSRSLSPPRSNQATAPPRRQAAAWKMQQPDEEAAFRTEVFSIHIPDENEEWLKFELSRLNQCTRIFPPEPKKTSKDSDGKDIEEGKEDIEEDKEEQEDEEEGEKKKDKESKEKDKESKEESKSGKGKSASYEEIMFQVFLQDRRQTMRMRCPLPNRAKSDDSSSFLPPLEPPVSSRSTMSSLGNGKGVVGWKAPPKPVAKEPPKQPTANQAESAKRLSQGLSVAQTRAARNQPTTSADANIYSVVLDPQEMNGNGFSMMNGSMQLSDSAWPSTKAHRLYEESRNNRMRIEAAKATSGAVLRQQVFYFDANTVAPPSGEYPPANIVLDYAHNGGINVGGISGIGMPNYVSSNSSVGSYKGPRGPAPYSKVTAPGGIIPVQQNPGIVNNNLNFPVGNGNMHPSQVGRNNSANGGVSSKQEELLRQLFPSWF